MSPVHPFSIGVLHLIIEIVRFVKVIVWFIVLEVFQLVTATLWDVGRVGGWICCLTEVVGFVVGFTSLVLRFG